LRVATLPKTAHSCLLYAARSDVVAVLRCQANLIQPLRCSMSLGIAPVALQAIPSAFPALVNLAVRALAVAKRWWLTLQHWCAPFLWNICLHGNKCSTGSLNKKLFCVPVSDFICCLVAVALLHSGSRTFIRGPLSWCVGVAGFCKARIVRVGAAVFRMCSIDADSAAQGRIRAAVND
jgi:hypothetical protein